MPYPVKGLLEVYDLTGMADEADGSVVLAQLQVAFLWECYNWELSRGFAERQILKK